MCFSTGRSKSKKAGAFQYGSAGLLLIPLGACDGEVVGGHIADGGLSVRVAEEDLIPSLLLAQDDHLGVVAQAADGIIAGARAGADVQAGLRAGDRAHPLGPLAEDGAAGAQAVPAGGDGDGLVGEAGVQVGHQPGGGHRRRIGVAAGPGDPRALHGGEDGGAEG